MSAHTPTPWRVSKRTDCKTGSNVYAGSVRIMEYPGSTPTIVSRANAAHIVRCVNAHDELVAALRVICAAERPVDAWNAMVLHGRAALAKAEAA